MKVVDYITVTSQIRIKQCLLILIDNIENEYEAPCEKVEDGFIAHPIFIVHWFRMSKKETNFALVPQYEQRM